MDYVAKFKERLGTLHDHLEKTNFRVCENISTDLTRTSEFVGFAEGVFIGEFLESLFDNLNHVTRSFEVEQEEIEPIKNEIDNLIRLINESISNTEVNFKSRLYDKMVSVRYLVTKFQVKGYRETKRKKGSLPEGIPIPRELLD